jgi:hypothetical protein
MTSFLCKNVPFPCTIPLLIGGGLIWHDFSGWPSALISNRAVCSGVRLRSTRSDAAALTLLLLTLSLSAASILNSLGCTLFLGGECGTSADGANQTGKGHEADNTLRSNQ